MSQVDMNKNIIEVARAISKFLEFPRHVRDEIEKLTVEDLYSTSYLGDLVPMQLIKDIRNVVANTFKDIVKSSKPLVEDIYKYIWDKYLSKILPDVGINKYVIVYEPYVSNLEHVMSMFDVTEEMVLVINSIVAVEIYEIEDVKNVYVKHFFIKILESMRKDILGALARMNMLDKIEIEKLNLHLMIAEANIIEELDLNTEFYNKVKDYINIIVLAEILYHMNILLDGLRNEVLDGPVSPVASEEASDILVYRGLYYFKLWKHSENAMGELANLTYLLRVVAENYNVNISNVFK